jgi:hypothetical protein
METGSGRGIDRWTELAAVSRAMPHDSGEPRFDACVRAGARAHHPIRLPLPMVAAFGTGFCDGVKRRRRPKRHETVCGPMERRQGGRNDRRPDLAAVPRAVPRAPGLRRRPVGRFRFGPRASPCSGARASLPVRLSVPMVAAVGSGFRSRRARNSASWRIYDRARSAREVPVGHRCVGQHADAHLSLFGNALLRANPTGRVYVRG